MQVTNKALIFIIISGLLLVSACAERTQPVELRFAAVYGNADVSCRVPAGNVQLTDLRFFVHDISLIDDSGNASPVQLLDDDTWQNSRVALLDFEDGQGSCLNGSAATNTSVRGKVRAATGGGSYRGVTFTVGVPDDANHGDPMIASPPLDQLSMHWHWLSGYKFLRAGVTGDTDSFWIHLGSSHCDGSIGAGIRCNSPNRVIVRIEKFDPQKERVALDLQELFAGISLQDGVHSDCSSGPAEHDCAAPFLALGIPFGHSQSLQEPQSTVFKSVLAR